MIALVFVSDIKYCPYIKTYLEILNENKIDFEVLYWDREGVNRNYPKNYISFKLKSQLNRHPARKLKDFIAFRNWLKKKIKYKKYEKIVMLSTLSALIVGDELLKNYKKKFILDIRDYSFENNFFYKFLLTKVIDNSYFTSISSEGFKNFLPLNREYIVSHNFNQEDLKYLKNFKKKTYGEKLVFTFIGGVRYFEHQSQIIDKLKNDSRFEMVYHGNGIELDKFKQYCQDKNIRNIIFTGEYDNSQKHRLLANADLLNNSYKTKKIFETKYAISNKFYDSLIFSIPQVVETQSFKQEIVEDNYLGIALDEVNKNYADYLYDYYHNIDEEQYSKNVTMFLMKVIAENKFFEMKIKEFLVGEVFY